MTREVKMELVAAAVAVICLLSLICCGCGGGALRSHATANEIAGVVVETAEGLYLAHLDAVQGECSDAVCVAEARAAHAPAEAAIGLVRIANKAYRQAITIANAAENGDSLVPALLTMVLRIAALWADMVAALATIGVTAPPLPFPLPGAVQ